MSFYFVLFSRIPVIQKYILLYYFVVSFVVLSWILSNAFHFIFLNTNFVLSRDDEIYVLSLNLTIFLLKKNLIYVLFFGEFSLVSFLIFICFTLMWTTCTIYSAVYYPYITLFYSFNMFVVLGHSCHIPLYLLLPCVLKCAILLGGVWNS